MTLHDFFTFLSEHPVYTISYMVFVPAMAGIIGILADDKANRSPWKEFYMILLYMICIPGIFAISLLVYSFLFEKQSIYNIDLITHVLPIVSMVATILLIRRSASLDDIPGFDKLTGLIMMISVALLLFWVLDKTRIILFSYLPFQYVLLIFIGLLLVFRWGLKKVF